MVERDGDCQGSIETWLLMAEMKTTTIKNTWKLNNRKEIKPTRGNIAHHAPWAPPRSGHRAQCHAHSLLLSLLLVLVSSKTVVLSTVVRVRHIWEYFFYLLWSTRPKNVILPS